MWKHIHLLMSILSLMAFTTNPDPGKNQGEGESDETPDPKKEDPPTDRSQWTEKDWQAEIQRIAAKEKAEGRKAAEREYQQRQDEARRKAELEKQESEGKYEEAKQRLTSDLESAQKARDEALQLLKANVDAQWDGLPDSVKKTYAGDEDDVLAKSAHIQQMKPIIDELAEKAESQSPGNRPNPKVASDKMTTDEKRAAAEKARRAVRPL